MSDTEADHPPPLTDICCKIEDEESDGWDEMEITGEQTTCLFCTSQFLTIAVALDHCRTEHNFDLLELKTRHNMDCYSFIKMINYIRINKPEPNEITEASAALWEDDKYLKPIETETWLMYDFEDLGSAPSTPHYAIDGKTPISNINYADLQRQIQNLTLEVRYKDNMLKHALEDILKMKEITRTIVDSGDSKTGDSQTKSLATSCDSNYFNSYSHFAIHHEMLNDKVRTESYRDAFLKNAHFFKGKTVLDVGCGTGILSMFAAKAGASKVFGIDQSDIVYKAMEIVRENNLEETVHLMRGQIENTQLPVEKVDLIVSEWMGYFLLFEGMLDSFIYARDTHLTVGGTLMPNRCSLSLVGCSDEESYKELIDFWDDVYGFSMQRMKADVITEPFIDTVAPEKVITSPCILAEFDLENCTVDACQFSSKFQLHVERDGVLTSLAGYFDVFFDLESKVMFSTGPHATKTHWQQTVFYLKKTLEVKQGQIIEGTLTCSRMIKNLRGLAVSLKIGEDVYQYNFG